MGVSQLLYICTEGEVWGVEFINCSLRMLMTDKLTIVGASAYTLRTPGGNHLPVAIAVGVGMFEIFVFFCFCWCFSRFFFFFIFALSWYSKRRVVVLRNYCGLWVCEWVRKRKRAAFVNPALTNFALFLHFQLLFIMWLWLCCCCSLFGIGL